MAGKLPLNVYRVECPVTPERGKNAVGAGPSEIIMFVDSHGKKLPALVLARVNTIHQLFLQRFYDF